MYETNGYVIKCGTLPCSSIFATHGEGSAYASYKNLYKHLEPLRVHIDSLF